MHAGRWVVIGIGVLTVAAIAVNVAMRRSLAAPSVVLITVDTLRADRLGAYGRSPSITPELDKLAARGVVFDKAWTTAPMTVPAHATLLTGLLPPKHGLRVNQPPAPLPAVSDRRFFTLAEVLKEQRYGTAAFVSASVLRADDTGLDAGFDKYEEVPRAAPGSLHDAERPGRGDEAVDHALAWVNDQSGAVFLWVHVYDPHAPYDAPVGWGAGPDHRRDEQGYDGEVRYADHCIGKLLDGLAASGRADAVVAVVADHGEGLGEHGEAAHGYLMHEATLHVPLIIASEGLAPGHRTEAVSAVDVFPTLISLAGHAVPAQVNGVPLFVKNPGVGAARPIYAESLYPWHASRWAQEFALRRGDEKIGASGPRTMVFDLAADPREERPAAPDAAQLEAIAEMMRVAREPVLGTMTPGPATAPAGPYWSTGSGGATPVLSDEENAKLPSPYDRMDLLREFDDACELVSSGKAAEALARFDEVLRRDPDNIQVAFWRGRTLESKTLRRDAEAAEAYRHAFELGFQSPKCVAKALACSLKAMQREAHPEVTDAEIQAESDRAASFLGQARAKGSRDNAETWFLEGFLRHQRGETDAARDALRRARGAGAGDELTKRGIGELETLLGPGGK